EAAVADFARAALDEEGVRAGIEAFAGEILVPGRINGLAQALLKMTLPGVPDIYQGTELWDLSLVDPDNRRPVDLALRAELLERIASCSPAELRAALEDPLDPGRPKLHLTRAALDLRRRRPEAFGDQATYRPLDVTGPKGV